MSVEDVTWALLAPVSRERLVALAEAYRREEGGADEDEDDEEYGDEDDDGWEVSGGTGDYSAILEREPGSEYTDEVPLAERISRGVKRPVYVLYLHKHFAGTDAVAVYERGRQTGTGRAPYALARSLGVTLPGDPEAGGGGETTPVRGVMVAEGISAADAARALGLKTQPAGPLHIVDGAAGALLYDDKRGSAPAFMWELSTAFPGHDVYTLITYPDEGRFRAWVMRDGKDAGTFDFPKPVVPADGPVLDSVKGETTPRGIAAALGLPAGLLNLDQWG